MRYITKLLLVIGICLISTFLISCDYEGYEEIEIYNQSDSQINIKFKSNRLQYDNSVNNDTIISILPKNKQIILLSPRGINNIARDDYQDTMNCFQYIRIHIVSNNNTINSVKNYRNRVNWIYNATDKWGTNYSTIITADDFK